MRTLLTDLPLDCRAELVDLLEEATQVGTWDWNITENTFLWSPRQFAHFGMRPHPAGAVGYKAWLEAIHGDDRAMVQAAMTHTIVSGEPLNITFRVLWREDDTSSTVDVHWLHSRGRLLRDADGAPHRMVGISADVTDVEQARALDRARHDARLVERFAGPSRFDVYFQSSRDCLFQMKVERDGRFTYQAINPAGLATIDMTMAAAQGLTPVDVLGADNAAKMVEALEAVVETGLPFSYEPTFSHARRSVTYDATYMPICNEWGEITTILGRARDITDERRTEADLRQAQKMESLGQMAAGVAHDFNNLLAGLHGCFNRLNRIGCPPEAQKVIQMGSHALKQGEALTRQLLTFARKQEVAVKAVTLNACIENMLGMLRSSLPGVTLVSNLTRMHCDVMADEGLVESCLLNLCINARDARPSGCEITIETQVLEPGASPHVELPSGNYALLSVRDNGPGMSADVLVKALEPFYTTKAPGKGTGLGLSMVYGTIRSLGGAVDIASTEGSGTVVTMYLRQSH